MGANAQTTVPTFVASQVLTAAQLNQSARTGVPVFANTTDRDAAFGGAGEKTLAEGQICYVENLTGVAQIQYYDGSSWISLSSGGLIKVAGETSFSAVSTVTLPNSTFTSTYKFYLLMMDFTATAQATLSFQVRSSGVTATANYYGLTNYTNFLNTTTNTGTNNAASLNIMQTSGSGGNAITFQLSNGFGKSGMAIVNANGTNSINTGNLLHGGFHNVSQNNDACVITVSTGSITGTYTVYGYAL